MEIKKLDVYKRQVMDGESFLTLAFEHLRPNGLYLFDEPEAALSPQRQLNQFLKQ